MDLPFILKKTLEKFLYPSGLFFILFFLGTILSFSRYRRSRARSLLVLGLFLFYFSHTPFLYRFLIKPLESKYSVPSLSSQANYKAIVLFPCYISNHKSLKIQERFDRETWARFWAALELKKRYPEVPLIIVGNGSPPGKGASYLVMLAEEMGWQGVMAIDGPRDTASSVKALVPILKGKSFIVVTSAYHLPRTMFLMHRAGLFPVAYPALYLSKPEMDVGLDSFWPQPHNIFYLNRVVHEYMGLVFYWLVAHL